MTDTEFVLDITPAAPAKKANTRIKIVGSNSYAYEIYDLVDEYDPILKTPTEHFSFDKPIVDPKYLALSMLETMKKRHGIGLAAPQCGINTRVFVMGGAEGVAYIMFNPIVIDSSGSVKMDEGCLSYPGLFLPITREAEVTMAYFDIEGKAQEKTFTGLTARVALHEIDHLYGVCFTTLVSPIILDRCKRKVKKNLKLLKAQREEQAKKELIAEAMKNLYNEGLKHNFPKDANAKIDYPDAKPLTIKQ